MLDVLQYTFPTKTVKPLPAVIDGGTYRSLTKSQKAALGVEIMRGRASLRPTYEVVARALGVSVSYVSVAARLTPDQLHRVHAGTLTISELISTTPAPVITTNDIVDWFKDASEGERAAVVAEVGVAPVWDAIAANLD
jgi:hypothetical protein